MHIFGIFVLEGYAHSPIVDILDIFVQKSNGGTFNISGHFVLFRSNNNSMIEAIMEIKYLNTSMSAES